MNFDLREARVNAGMTQRELAAEVGVSLTVVQRLENGGVAHPANAKKVADRFDVEVRDLMEIVRKDAA